MPAKKAPTEEKTWKDFPRKTDKVAIVGFAPTTRDLAPYDDPEYEIWIVNEEYNFPWCKRYDRLFQMHQEWDFGRTGNMNHANHALWIRNQSGKCMLCDGKGSYVPMKQEQAIECSECKGTGTYTPNRPSLPIYMQRSFGIADVIPFPLEDAIKFTGEKYFRSSFAYMITLAMLMDFKRIELYGFEMGTETEYNYQKPNGEFLIGMARGLGFDVYLPPACTLLKGNLYGYEDSRIGYRQNLEIRKLVLDGQIKKQQAIVEKANAEAEVLRYVMEHPEANIMELLSAKAVEYTKANDLLHFVKGAKRETENTTAMYDKYFTGPSEQEDPVAYNYAVTRENVKVEYAFEP